MSLLTITDETLSLVKGNIGRGCAVTLVVGNDLHTIILLIGSKGCRGIMQKLHLR